MDENKKIAELEKEKAIKRLGVYTEKHNPNIMYMLFQERNKDKILDELLSDFSYVCCDMERLDIVEKILFHVTGASYVSKDFYRKNINSQYFFILEVLDLLSFISFSVRETAESCSDLELSNIVNSEFEELKFNIFISLSNLEYNDKKVDIKCRPEDVISMFKTISLIDKKRSQKLFYEFTNVVEKFDLIEQDKINQLKNSDIFLYEEDSETNKVTI